MLWNPGATHRGSRAGGSGIAGTCCSFVSLVIARKKVQQVAAFIDVAEWYHVKPAACIYSVYVRDFLSAQELSGFLSLHQPPITIHVPALVRHRSRHR